REKLHTDSIHKKVTFKLIPRSTPLEAVEIGSTRKQKLRKQESVSIQLVEEEFIKEAQAGNLMQTLQRIPGINSMDIGTGISKPMIRGLGYYRVVVAKNGIKQEGQQWSNHHGVSVDQHSVDHVEIIKGPATLQYGTDAIGGVINILPSHIPLTGEVEGELFLTAKSNTNWLGGSANMLARRGDIYIDLTISYQNYSDFKIPHQSSYLLPVSVNLPEASHTVQLGDIVYNTAGKEKAVSLTTGIVKDWGNSYVEFNYYSSESGFFDWQGIQHDSSLNEHAKSKRDVLYPKQITENYALNFVTNRYFGKNKLELSIGYQANITEEYAYFDNTTGDRKADFDYYRALNYFDLGLNLHTWTANTIFSYNKSSRHQFKTGINSQYQQHFIDGFNHILPKYKRLGYGGFITHKYQLSDNWIINTGVRGDVYYVHMEETLNPEPFGVDSILNPSFKRNYFGNAISFGINYLPTDNTIVKLNIGKTYRVPSIYELGAYGLHRHQGRFEKGDIKNNPEQAWQFDLGIEQNWEKIQLSLSPFLNLFTNYLYLSPTQFIQPGAGQVYQYKQTKAMLTGGEFNFNYKYLDYFDLNWSAEYVYAVNLDLDMALPFTPPLTMKTELNYHFKNRKLIHDNVIGLELINAMAQNYTVPNELNTPGYMLVNLSGKTDINIDKQQIKLMLKIRNLLNTKYYNHISFYRRLRIPEPGRDIQLSVILPFNQ
ncbi:MAG: TonB-dependent receptor, partial [Bacteroidales bacterium]|nr:TonB-dependent receptor [Bacteroidales bacterium]